MNAPFGNSYIHNWKNYSNIPGKPKPPAYIPPAEQQQFSSTSTAQQMLPLSSLVEQAILNLSKVVGTFVEEQKVLNVQTSKKIEAVESSLNRKLDNMHSEISKLSNQNLQSSNQHLQSLEKGKAPFQAQQYPKVVNEIGLTEDLNARTDEVKAVVTLRSGKKLKPAVPELVKSAPLVADPLQEEQSVGKEEVKIKIPPPFPQALRGKKKASQQAGILEVLRQVQVNIPLLDIIKQVPAYENFLKDLCTVKKGLGIEKKAFLTEQFSAIIQSKYTVKYKDPGSPTISVNIGGNCINKSLLDLGFSVNLMPYSVYKQFGLGELKPTNITLSLADRSVKIPKGIVEDVLVKIDKIYYLVDFVVLDTEPIVSEPNHVPIILGRPFLATANAIINCRNGVMQLTFGNMTLELNIFHLNNKHKLLEHENQITDEVVSNGQYAGKQSVKELQGIVNQGDEEILVLPSTPTASQLINSKAITEDQVNNWTPNTKESAQAAAGVEEIILLDPH